MTTYQVELHDNENKKSRSTFPVNPSATDIQLTAIHTALNPFAISNVGNAFLITRVAKDTGTPSASADPDARVARRCKVSWTESVAGLTRSTTIGGVDTSKFAGTDTISLADTDAAALVTAIEAAGQDPDTGGTLTVQKIELVS